MVFITEQTKNEVQDLFFHDLGNGSEDNFFREQMSRDGYINHIKRLRGNELIDFIFYQKAIWLDHIRPKIGREIFCHNPYFRSIKNIKLSKNGKKVYTRASLKENGYRMQLHKGLGHREEFVKAFTRQLTRYDLRMFPELHNTFDKLPLMIGDAELISRYSEHIKGFNIVQERIPGPSSWPKRGELFIEDNKLEKLLNSDMFDNHYPKKDFELSLSFHGLYAISDPNTWNESYEVQNKNLISLCGFPVNYKKMDQYLDALDEYLAVNELNAHVVERKVIHKKSEIADYFKEKEDANLEGIVVSQYLEEDCAFNSTKIKKYETIDCAVMGINLIDKEKGLQYDNLKNMVVGLWDESLNKYLPACDVNLNINGPQVSSEEKKQHLINLNENLIEDVYDKVLENNALPQLKHAYMEQMNIKLQYALGKETVELQEFPRGQYLHTLYDLYEKDPEKYNSIKKSSPAKAKWIYNHKDILEGLKEIKDNPVSGVTFNEVNKYSKIYSNIKSKTTSLNPHLAINTDEPLVVEVKVMKLDYGLNKYPSGFHSWYGNSFKFDNKYIERIRYDKASTTPYSTVIDIAKANSVKRKRLI